MVTIAVWLILVAPFALAVPLVESVLFAARFGRGKRHVYRGVVTIWLANEVTFAIGLAAFTYAKPALYADGYGDQIAWAAFGAWCLLSLALTHVFAPKL